MFRKMYFENRWRFTESLQLRNLIVINILRQRYSKEKSLNAFDKRLYNGGCKSIDF